MNKTLRALCLCGLAAILSSPSFAVVEEDVKIDWANLRAKTTGVAQPTPGQESDWKQLERAAWQDALRKFEDYYAKADSFKALDKKELRELVKKHTLSINTAYYGDGSVRIQFENQYAELLPSDSMGLKSDVVPELSSRNTGLIFRVKGKRDPAATYQVINKDSNEVLFSSKDVSKDAFSKNLMGRWISHTQKTLISSAAGAEPAEVSMELVDGNLMVSKTDWDAMKKGNEALLQNARIAIVQSP